MASQLQHQALSNTDKQEHRLLFILLDMNGTLLYRRKPKGILTSRAPDFVHDVTAIEYYLRPGAVEFIKFLLSHPQVHPGVLTSMRHDNALPAVLELEKRAFELIRSAGAGGKELEESSLGNQMVNLSLQEKVPTLSSMMPMFCGGDFNVPDKNRGVKPWDSMRKLELVWEHEYERLGQRFDGTNTLMIDDSLRKMRYYPLNVLQVSEYDEDAVQADDDDELVHLMKYMKFLLEDLESTSGGKDQRDVRHFVEATPWKGITTFV